MEFGGRKKFRGSAFSPEAERGEAMGFLVRLRFSLLVATIAWVGSQARLAAPKSGEEKAKRSERRKRRRRPAGVKGVYACVRWPRLPCFRNRVPNG